MKFADPDQGFPPSPCSDSCRLACQVTEASNFLRLLASETRLRILLHLYAGETSVGDLKHHLNVSRSTAVRILSEFRYAGIVGRFRKDRTTYYRIVDERVCRQLELLHKIFCSP